MKRELKEAIEKLAGTKNKDLPVMVVCTVKSVDLQAQTCVCTPVSGDASTEIPGVALKADPTDGILIVPKVDSTVVVSFSINTIAYVSLFSDVASVEWVIGNGTGQNPTKLKIDANQVITLNDGTFNGLVKVGQLVTKLNAVENDLNILKAAFVAWVVAPGDGGAALKAATAAWTAATITPTVQATLENTKIKHGV